MFKLIKFIFVSAIIAVFIFIIAYSNAVNKPADKNGKDLLFTVRSGESVSEIARDLKIAGIIKSDNYFKLYVRLNNLQAGLQAGDYFVSPRMTIKEISAKLSGGEVENREKNFKIIEGWTIDDINEYLMDNKFLSDNSFLNLAKTNIGNWKLEIEKPDFLQDAPAGVDLEGYLFPDTYRVYSDATAEDIIEKALNNFGIKLSADLRKEISRQGKSIHDIITMASIIEKEVSGAEDRKLVSGIFWKRIALGVALQADSTINYVTGKNAPAISLEDRGTDSLFNTYKYPDLPPGPICNPGIDSIKAAIYPKESQYLYYLNRQDSGETIFSKTYEEHLRNKNKYLR